MNSTTPVNATTPQRPGRGAGLLVRYWACNMTLAQTQGASWPGFGYSADEQDAMRAVASRVSSVEFVVWMVIVVILALSFFAGLAVFGLWLMTGASAGHSLDSVSAAAFLLNLGVQMVASLAVGLPAAMLAASVLTGRLFRVGDADLPDPQARAHYAHKLSFQLTRAALLMGAIVVALCLWLPDRVWLLTHSIVPVLAPALSLGALLYYRHRVR